MDINEDTNVNISNIQQKNINKDGHDIKKRMERQKSAYSFNKFTSETLNEQRTYIKKKVAIPLRTYVHTYVYMYLHNYIAM